MSSLQAVRSVARGERPNGELLPPCRLEAFGAEFYGEEAIIQRFRQSPFPISDHASIVQVEGQLAVFEHDTALFADLCEGKVSRLWRLGPGPVAAAEPAIDVPFDADLSQTRGDVAMRAEDHPDISAQAYSCLEQIGRRLSREWSEEEGPAPYRIRAFLIRAFTQDNVGAALFSLHQLGHSPVRTSGFSYAAALFRVEGSELISCRIVRDSAGAQAIDSRAWRPRVA
jgi:hypothetical protein